MLKLCPAIALLLLLVPIGSAQTPTYVDRSESVKIESARGVDDMVDYASLIHFGPWDDRNYELTQGDLAFLAPNEAQIREPIPAFYRVLLRKHLADLGPASDVRYPLSALNVFRQNFGGYLIDGKYYRKAEREGDRYYVIMENGLDEEAREAGADFIDGEVRVTSPEGAAESAIAIHPTNTDLLVAGTNGPNGGQRMHFSVDGGQSWTQSEDLPLGGTCCDPTVEWSSDGQYAYTATLGCTFIFCDLWFYRSDDGGQTWTSLESETPGDPRREVADGADREYMHVDLYEGSPYQDNIYLMYHNGNVMRFARSTDLGNTWSAQAFSDATEERGIAGDITTDKNGHIYYPWPAFNSQTIRLRKSTDGGQTFGESSVVAETNAAFSFPIPAMESREVAVYIAADADLSDGPYANSIYLAWTDATGPTSGDPQSNHAWIRVAYSRDGGETWDITTPHETDDVNSVDRWQAFLAVGPDGTVHVIYHDTRRSPDRTGADVFYSYSTDGAQTWSTPERVTSELSPNIDDGFEYGDYSGLDIVMDDLIAIFTDNRDESGGGAESVDVYAAGITPGSSGGGSGAPGRILGSLGFEGDPLLVDKLAGGDLELDWSPVCGDGSDYAVYEGELGLPDSKAPVQCSTGGATSTTLTPANGQTFYLVAATDGSSSEGSYGRTSEDLERAPAASPCFPQSIGPCP